MKISGAPGFDKYVYTEKIDRERLLSKYGKSEYRKVIGYAGWTFGKLFTPEKNLFLANLGRTEEEGTKWLEEQLEAVRFCMKAMIEAFPDVLFIFKKHPRENFESDRRDSPNEMNVFLDYPNVLYLKNEEDVNHLISISDLWMAFESSTIMEAWLAGIPTLMVNPDPNFTRVNLFKGSTLVQDKEALIRFIQNFYSKEHFAESEEVVSERSAILSESIGFGDGLNHLRSLYFYDEHLNKPEANTKYTVNWKYLRLYILLHLGKFFFSKRLFSLNSKFKKTIWVFESYELKNANAKKKFVYRDLDRLYKKFNIFEKFNSGELFAKFKSESI